MKSLFSVFIKSLLFFFLLFTLPRIIEYYFFPVYLNGKTALSLESRMTTGLISGLLAAVFITLVQFLYVRYWSKKIDMPGKDLNFTTSQYLEMKTESPLLSVFQDLKDRMQQKKWKLIRQDIEKGLLEFKVEHKWQIPNDHVTIRLEPETTQSTVVKIGSKMKSLINLTDNAHNLRNIYLVKQALQ